MQKSIDLSSDVPLTEATFFILLSLAAGPRHGYAIIKDVRNISQGRVSLSTGTLFGALKRLLEKGWILRFEDGNQESSGRQRKFYQLTGLGKQILLAEMHRMDQILQEAQLRVARHPTG